MTSPDLLHRHHLQPPGDPEYSGLFGTDTFALTITPESAGWSYSGLTVRTMRTDESLELTTGDVEMLVLPLAGSCSVSLEGERLDVRGRPDVFSGPTDFVYVPRDSSVVVTATVGGRFAFPSARCTARKPFRHQPADAVPVELRGAGRASRQVNNFCTPEAFDADKLIACEVVTPGGNWSSYPPHKHDESSPTESVLEEIYYFEIAPGPGGPGMAYQRVYGHGDTHIDVLAEVRSGDTVLIPYGWHGPSMAVPGYDLYYLNVMAGPDEERSWLICDDPAHAWVRATWADQEIDPRLLRGGRESR